MLLYRGDLTKKDVDPIFSHFGSHLASAHRIESAFAISNPHAFDGQQFIEYDYNQNPTGKKRTPKELASKFAEHAKKTTIRGFDCDIKKPLRLADHWMDDPIASGGLQIFENTKTLSDTDKKELTNLFAPFTYNLYPDEVYKLLTTPRMKAILKAVKKNKIASNELKKRQSRSLAIGENFKKASAHEAVWVYLSVKLRNWANEKGYDSFVYANIEEGDGGDSYVTLNNNQISTPTETLIFNHEKYEKTILPHFDSFIKIQMAGPPKSHTDTFWAGRDPTSFWIPSQLNA